MQQCTTMDVLRTIIDRGKPSKVDGKTIDVLSAYIAVQLYDTLGKDGRLKLDNMHVYQVCYLGLSSMKVAYPKEYIPTYYA